MSSPSDVAANFVPSIRSFLQTSVKTIATAIDGAVGAALPGAVSHKATASNAGTATSTPRAAASQQQSAASAPKAAVPIARTAASTADSRERVTKVHTRAHAGT